MLAFRASKFFEASGNLDYVSALAGREYLDWPPEKYQTEIRNALDVLIERCQGVPLSPSVVRQAKYIRDEALGLATDGFSDLERASVLGAIGGLRRALLAEMDAHLFVWIHDKQRQDLILQPEPVFGFEVYSRFPDAARDIVSAGHCLGYEQWTAAVFHLMRALEYGLRDLAHRVGVIFPKPIELLNWQNIIEQIEKEVREAGKRRQRDKTLEASKETEFYSQAASQFYHFKDAWRNHVAHARATYDEGKAHEVFYSVRAFMQNLASRESDET